MSDKNGIQTAFPVGPLGSVGFGLTKREYFAGQALAGFLSILGDSQVETVDPRNVARQSVAIADAVLSELEKEKP